MFIDPVLFESLKFCPKCSALVEFKGWRRCPIHMSWLVGIDGMPLGQLATVRDTLEGVIRTYVMLTQDKFSDLKASYRANTQRLNDLRAIANCIKFEIEHRKGCPT